MDEGLFYDRDGEPITEARYRELFWHTPDYKVICQTDVGEYQVSTIWLGINYNAFNGRPLIFETMVFGSSPKACLRAPCEETAWRFHAEMVDKWGGPL